MPIIILVVICIYLHFQCFFQLYHITTRLNGGEESVGSHSNLMGETLRHG